MNKAMDDCGSPKKGLIAEEEEAVRVRQTEQLGGDSVSVRDHAQEMGWKGGSGKFVRSGGMKGRQEHSTASRAPGKEMANDARSRWTKLASGGRAQLLMGGMHEVGL